MGRASPELMFLQDSVRCLALGHSAGTGIGAVVAAIGKSVVILLKDVYGKVAVIG